MRSATRGIGVVCALFCCSLLLAVVMAAPAQAGRAALPASSALHGSMAPLNPAFLRYLVGPPVGAPTSSAGGHALGGVIPAPLDFSSTRGMQVPGVRAAALPATYDLRTLGRVTAVKDQNPAGTCWAFASLGSLESCLLPGETWDFSEDNLVLNNGFGPFPWGPPYEAGGNYEMATAYLVRWGGPVNESEDAYLDGLTPSGLTARKHVQDVYFIPPRASALDNANIKNAVMQYGGVDVSMLWSEWGDYYSPATASYYYDHVSDRTNHDVLVVGWDDDYPAGNFATTPPGNGAFIVKNSWGTSWGSSGFFYASYYDTALGRLGPMAVYSKAESASNYAGIYQYDPLGAVAAFGYFFRSTGWFANVFTAHATASLSAVGFYALAPGSSYKVYTGSSLATKKLRTSGTLAYMGYHTVTLPSAVGIAKGQHFVVAVKITSPGEYPIAIEDREVGWSTAATAAAGQSYVSWNGSSWTDLTTQSGAQDANVCLKAYVKAPIAAPTVTGFTPVSGPVGTSVTLTGSGFTGATAVTFNGAAATSFSVDSATQITASVPPGAMSGAIAVTTPAGTAVSTASFSVTALPGAPTLTSFAPASGAVGTAVTLTGSGFTGATAVTFNGPAAASFSVLSATQITATVPGGATTGTIAVTNPAGTGAGAASFAVKPTITRLSPSSGKRMATVTITGSGFGAAQGTGFVKFGSKKCGSYVSWSGTQIKCKVPAKATYGSLNVKVSTAAGTSNGKRFGVKP